MGIPIHDDPLEPTDEELLVEPTAPPDLPADVEVPLVDAADQQREIRAGWRIGRRSSDPEAPDADALDQAMIVPADDDTEM